MVFHFTLFFQHRYATITKWKGWVDPKFKGRTGGFYNKSNLQLSSIVLEQIVYMLSFPVILWDSIAERTACHQFIKESICTIQNIRLRTYRLLDESDPNENVIQIILSKWNRWKGNVEMANLGRQDGFQKSHGKSRTYRGTRRWPMM